MLVAIAEYDRGIVNDLMGANSRNSGLVMTTFPNREPLQKTEKRKIVDRFIQNMKDLPTTDIRRPWRNLGPKDLITLCDITLSNCTPVMAWQMDWFWHRD